MTCRLRSEEPSLSSINENVFESRRVRTQPSRTTSSVGCSLCSASLTVMRQRGDAAELSKLVVQETGEQPVKVTPPDFTSERIPAAISKFRKASVPASPRFARAVERLQEKDTCSLATRASSQRAA